MASVYDVAKFLLSLQDEDAGDTISNLKLQKLLYYAQGYYLATHGFPLFPEKVRKWAHGPVIREIYDEYREHVSGAIPRPADADFGVLDKEDKEFLREIHRIFGQYSAWKLRNMTHSEAPWKDAGPNSVISTQAMKTYFSEFVSE